MYERFCSGGWAGALAFAAFAGAMGGGPDWRNMSLDEVEDYCVKRAIRNRRELERKAVRAIAELARATGAARQHFGYCCHTATRARGQSDSLQRMLGKKKKKKKKRAA